MTLPFRPHHFLCALCFQGKGYSAPFVRNFTAIMDRLNSEAGQTTVIEVVDHTDSICAPCPHKRALLCTSQEKITALDGAHAAALSIQPGDKISWQAAKKRIAEKIDLATFHRICHRCSWKSAGICETVLTDFLEQEQAC